MVAEPADDHRLVAAVRRGDDRAFEALYSRYQRRIHAYVLGMVKDHGRAEDVTQEVFVSALRRMRETERPIAFKPWIYEIAKNACIDQFRRSKRAEEVSLEADDGLAPGDYGKLVGSDPTPDMAVAAKQDLDNLCGAFGGLSETHHEILVMRELEGLSYREIGDRMGMSRPAVESTLFRARRRLTEEYDELVSGARCMRIQSLIAAAGETRLGTRESRRLSRHVAHCQPCRREAMAAGLDSAILTHVPLRKRAAEKIAGLLPFGWFGRSRGGSDGGSAAATQLPMLSEQLSGGWGKLATAAAVLVAGVGAAGVGTKVVGMGDDTPAGADKPPAQQAGAAAKAAAPEKAAASRTSQQAASDKSGARQGSKKRGSDRSRRQGSGTRGGDTSGAGAQSALPAGETSGSGGRTGTTVAGTQLPQVKLPVGTGDPAAPVRDVVNDTVDAAQPVVNEVTDAVEEATGLPIQEPVEETVEGVQGTLDGALGGSGGLPAP